ncbi:MAG: hypothetical protein NW203_02495 [Hyphomonadaceae bacterium]|nr:hypothetical protein [Hyphomonadaceae bacterium]
MTRRRARRRQDALGAALIAVAFAALAAMAAAGFLLRPPPTDPDTLCRTDRGVAQHTIVLVDATDALEPRHRRRLRAVVEQERARLAPYGRLTIARLRPARPSDPEILFSLCTPRAGEDANPLFENPQKMQAHWDAAFGAAMTRALRRAGASSAAQASPITAGLRAIAADVTFTADIQARRIVLVSDLLEFNPQGFSLYADGVDFAAFAASRDGAAGPPDLENVDVRVVTLDRDDQAARQARARAVFWAPYFDAASARSVEFDAAP